MSGSPTPSKEFTRPLSHLLGKKPAAPDWFEASIAAPSEEGEVNVSGAKIRYSAWGDRGNYGLLFVHGGRAHRNWWRPFAPFFADHFRVAALDLSGMGDSDWRDSYSLELLVDEVFAVIDAAGLSDRGRPIVIGHSFGGWVTLGAVERMGQRLSGAVVIDSPLSTPDPDEGYKVVQARSAGDKPPRSNRVYESIEEPIQRFRLLPDQPAEHLYVLDYIAREGLKSVSGSEGEGWSWKFDPNTTGNFSIQFERELLRAARCPLAFVYGQKSAFASDENLGHLRDQAKGRSPFIVMPEAHHHLMLDQPLGFVSTLRALLACWPIRAGF